MSSRNILKINYIFHKIFGDHKLGNLGLDFSNFKAKSDQKTDTPTILWNHRWEYDKKPELFFDVMKKIKDKNIKPSPIIKKNKENKESFEKKVINKKSIFSLSKIFSYLLVFIISFIALILILETFKSYISDIFPGLEILLYNLFETVKDIFLFSKNLIN